MLFISYCLFTLSHGLVAITYMQTMALKILSVNCQGLGSIEKRLDVFNYLKKVIYIVSKTHTLLKHLNVFSDPSGIMNACLAQEPLTLEEWLFFLIKP